MKIIPVAVALASALTWTSAVAADLHPVKPLAGYQCMVVDTPESMDMDFDHPVSLHQEPSSNSPTFAPVAEIIAVAEPPETQNGFVKTMNFAFRPGWIETKWLKPYTAIHPGKTCTPSVMNDGKLGFDFRRR